MSKKSISIRVKEEGKKSVRTTIDVEYGDAIAKYKKAEENRKGNDFLNMFGLNDEVYNERD